MEWESLDHDLMAKLRNNKQTSSNPMAQQERKLMKEAIIKSAIR